MSYKRSNRKDKKALVKKKKVISKKKRKRKPLSSCNDKKQTKNTDDKDQKNKNNDITVERSKLMCRRYEEFHENFLNYDKILGFLQKTQKCNPTSVDLVKIGNSAQGKPIYMILITSSFSTSNDPKMATFVEAGLNGENAIAVSNTLYMIEYLTKNPNFIKIMDYFIVPCCNPDAYDDFIKKREKENTKSANKSGSHCKSESDISKSGKKDQRKPGCDSPRGEKRHCDNPNKDKTDAKKSRSDSPSQNPGKFKNSKNKSDLPTQICQPPGQQSHNSVRVDLSLNFPVVLGLTDMRRIPTDSFLEKIKYWKENFISNSPECRSLTNAIYKYQFATKLLISLREGGESVCYPYGFCNAAGQETSDLREVAKKGKCGINGRNFQYGSIYDVQGLTYGNLVDFLKIDKSSIKYMYVIQVHKKTPRYTEKEELKQLMRYGCEIMECVKRMSCAVYKSFTDMTGNRKVETESTKSNLDKRSSF